MHALRGWRAHRRLIAAVALTLSLLLVALVAVQSIGGSARAAVSLLCNQQTLYSVSSAGPTSGGLASIDVSGDASAGGLQQTAVQTYDVANNALGLSADGANAYAVKAAPTNTNGVYTTTLQRSVAGAAPTTLSTALPVPTYTNTAGNVVNYTVIRGAVDPANGIYYYATGTVALQGGGTRLVVLAYDLAANTPIGQVGVVNDALPATTAGGAGANGDLAFSTSGDMFIVGANKVIRVDSPPTTADAARVLTTKPVTTLDASVNSPGIAFTSDGFLYVTSTTTTGTGANTTYATNVVKLNPGSGDVVWTRAIAGNYQTSDLATCNYPDTVAAQVDVQGRWHSGDQFTVSLASTTPDTKSSDMSTTTGTARGVQANRAGAVLTVPGRIYTVSESAAGTTSLSDYSTTWSCTDVNDPGKKVIASGTGPTGSVTIPSTPAGRTAGVEVECTFVNTVARVASGARNDSGTTTANTTLTAGAPGLLANDTGDGLTAAKATDPTHGTATVASDGSWTYTPASDFSGTDSFTYTATDGGGNATTATVTITVTPTAGADSIAAVAGSPASTNVLANDHGTSLTATVGDQPTHGTVTIDGQGVATYTPAAGFSGTDSFTYTAKDPSGNTVTGTVTVTVAPRAVDDTIATTTGTTATKDLLANDQGSNLTASLSTGPANGTLVLDPSGKATYTPTQGFSGTDSFTYTVTDGTATSAPATVTITVGPSVVDDAYTATSGTPLSVPAGTGVLANDSGSGLTVTGTSTPTAGGTVTVSPAGAVTYTPAAGFSGTDTFTYTAKDSSGTTGTATVTVTVQPTAGDDTIDGRGAGPFSADLLANDSGTALTPTITTQPANGTVTIGSDGIATYTPAPGTSGDDSFTYTVTDPSGNTATGTVTVIVRPDAVNDRIQSLAGDAGTKNLLANDVGTGLTITDHSTPANGTLTIDPDGTATFTPDAGWSGNTSFTYTVTDTAGRTDTATVFITVGVVAKDDAGTTEAGSSLSVDAAHGVLANDQGRALSAAIVANRGPQHGNVTLNGDGSFVYTPADGFSGTDTFTYTATDPDGTRARATVTITVTPTATVSGQTTTVDAGGSVEGAIAIDGSDTSAAVTTAPQHGTVVLHDDGTYTYTPAPGYSGDDSFEVTVTDGSGQTATVTVPVVVRPTAIDDSYGTAAGEKVVVAPAAGVLANDLGWALQVTGFTMPAHGTVSIAKDGSLVYTPNAGYSGPDSFTYQVTDQANRTATAIVTIAVGVVTAPDTATATADTELDVDAAHGVLANDQGDGLTATKATDPAHGTVTVAADGSYVYTPEDGFSGQDSFTYTAEDSSGAEKTDTVTITVLPKAVGDTYTVGAGQQLDVVPADGVLANDSGTGISVASNGKPAHGTVTVDADGSVHYVPAPGFSGTDTFTYVITDRSGGQATATVTVTVEPLAVPDVQATPTGTPLRTTPATGILSNDLGVGLTVIGHTDPQHGTLVLAADGSGTYTPDAGFSGTDAYEYTVVDQAGNTSTTTVTIVVGPVATADRGTTRTGSTLTVDAAHGVLANDAGTGLTVVDHTAPQHGTVQVSADGSYVYTPAKGFSGTDTFTYTTTDADGTRTTGVVTITVLPKASDDAYRTAADTAVTRSIAKGPLANDRGTDLHVVAVGKAKHGTVVLDGSGKFVYTPTKGFSGKDSFTYTVEDAAGGRDTATVTVTVTPKAVDDSYVVVGGRPTTIGALKGVLGDDSGSDLWVAVKTQPRHGTVTLTADGSFRYTPDEGYAGKDSFTYTLTDGAGNTTTATVYLTVAAPAKAADDSAHGKPGQPTTLQVLDNDTPSTGTTLDTGTLVLVDPATKGTGTAVTVRGSGDWTVQDGALVFTPAPGFSGTASITYRVTDGDGVTVTATATVDYPTPAQVAATTLAYTGGASLGWLALVAAAVILVGAALRRRRGDAEAGPRRSGN